MRVVGGDGYLRTAYKGLELTYLFHRDTHSQFLLQNERTIPTDQTLSMVTASYSQPINSAWSYRARLLYNRRDGNTCLSCHDPRGSGTLRNGLPADVDSERESDQRTWANLQFDYSPASSHHSVIFGLEHQSERTSKEVGQRSDRDRQIFTTGFFAQVEVTVRPNVIATFGARLDRNEHTGVAVSPSASIVYQPRNRWILKALF